MRDCEQRCDRLTDRAVAIIRIARALTELRAAVHSTRHWPRLQARVLGHIDALVTTRNNTSNLGDRR